MTSFRLGSLWLLIMLITGLLGWQASRLPYRYAVADLFPAGDSTVQAYEALQAAFADSNQYMALGIHTPDGVFQGDFLPRLDSLSVAIPQLSGVVSVSSLTTERFLRADPLGWQQELPLVHPFQPARYARDSAWLLAMPPIRYTFLSPDARTSALYLKLTPGLGRAGLSQLVGQIDSLTQRYRLLQTALTGGPYSAFRQEQLLQQDMWRMGAISLLWVLAMLWLAFRRWWGVVLPLLIIGLSVLWTLGLMKLLGGALNLMTILLPTLLFVVGTSDVIHLLMHYREALSEGMSPLAAVRHSRRSVGLALFLTSFTTALGFLMLRFTAGGPFGELGIYTALGVGVAYGLTMGLIPPLLPFLAVPTRLGRSLRWEGWYHLFQYRRHLRRAALVLAALALPGLLALQTDAFFSRELRGHTAEARELDFFETYLGGTRPFLLGFSVPEGQNLWTPDKVRAMARVEDYLVTHYGLNRPYSLIGDLRAVHSSMHRARPEAFRLPEPEGELANLIAYYRLYTDSTRSRPFLTPDGRMARLTGTLPDLGLQEMERLHAGFRAYLARDPLPDGLRLTLSGAAELLDQSHRLFVRRMGGGLLLALGVVSLMMGLLFRSWRMAFLAMIPNLLPLLVIAGGMGLLGVGLNMSTAIIFTVSFGIAVDDSIHFLSRLYVEQKAGKSLPLALRRTWLSTGRAMLWTSGILIGGFLALLGSSFEGTWLTGLLVSLILLLALGGDLLLLPVLLLGRKKNQGSKAKRI
ncbi:MAG: hypothetical protein D6722_20260 [Bacteroidetes bacterium]|nr:MAG: hypothetical protein D6722_20260 [Bacteroidota bacterium]